MSATQREYPWMAREWPVNNIKVRLNIGGVVWKTSDGFTVFSTVPWIVFWRSIHAHSWAIHAHSCSVADKKVCLRRNTNVHEWSTNESWIFFCAQHSCTSWPTERMFRKIKIYGSFTFHSCVPSVASGRAERTVILASRWWQATKAERTLRRRQIYLCLRRNANGPRMPRK